MKTCKVRWIVSKNFKHSWIIKQVIGLKNDLYKLLKNKEIIAILDGDTNFGVHKFNDLSSTLKSLPYLTGPQICELSSLFGYPQTYSTMSRWQYFDILLDSCIADDRCSDLLAYLLGISQFQEKLGGHSSEEISTAHEAIITAVLNGINGLLFFGGNELVNTGNKYIVKPLGSAVHISAPKIKTIDREYIKSISGRALEDVENGNYDSAITKSRTLLEETFCYVIEQKCETPSDSGDIGKLYKEVRRLYNMHTDANADRRINTLLSGLNNIVTAIAEMRNKNSDAHGVGAKRINIDEHHARLFVNSSMTMADFIISVQQKQK